MKAVAIIPARGGSKGVPGKNLKRIGGISLVGRAVRAAQGAASIDQIFVSTDDDDIAAEAKNYGAQVIWRPASISGDAASSESAILHSLEEIFEALGRYPETTVFIQCTSPFIESRELEGALRKMDAEGADSLLSVVPSHAFIWREDASQGAFGINHDKSIRKRRQELEPEYRETGAFYMFNTHGFIESKHRFFGKTVLYVLESDNPLEIDSLEDLEMARLFEGKQNGGLKVPFVPQGIVFDFDGVFTNNKVLTHQDGTESVVCDRSDGMGLSMAKALGIRMLILSKERNPVVLSRAKKVGIEVMHGVDDKPTLLKRWASENGLNPAELYFVGNDINDVACLELVGCGVVVADAYQCAVDAADLKLSKPGGHGAIRELIELIIEKKNNENS